MQLASVIVNAEPRVSPNRQSWWRVLVVGTLAWAGAVVATSITRDPVLLPGAFVIGSFLMPFTLLVALLAYIAPRWLAADRETALTPYRVLLAFAAGGAIGVWPSALVEHLIVKAVPDAYFPTVALTEETIKAIIVWFLAGGLAFYRRRDGLVLGAAVGLGFSAFESFGYAFDIAKTTGLNVPAVLETQLSRGLLTPVGHALWTALVAGALFAASSAAGRRTLAPAVFGWLGVAIVLHLGWDVSSSLAALLVASVVGESLTLAQFRAGTLPDPSVAERTALGALRTALLSINAVLGLLLARWQWRKDAAAASGRS